MIKLDCDQCGCETFNFSHNDNDHNTIYSSAVYECVDCEEKIMITVVGPK